MSFSVLSAKCMVTYHGLWPLSDREEVVTILFMQNVLSSIPIITLVCNHRELLSIGGSRARLDGQKLKTAAYLSLHCSYWKAQFLLLGSNQPFGCFPNRVVSTGEADVEGCWKTLATCGFLLEIHNYSKAFPKPSHLIVPISFLSLPFSLLTDNLWHALSSPAMPNSLFHSLHFLATETNMEKIQLFVNNAPGADMYLPSKCLDR